MSVQDDKQDDQVVINDVTGNKGGEAKHDQIVLEGDESTSSDDGKKITGPGWLHRRVRKLNDKVDAAEGRANESDARSELLKEENKLLRMQVDALKSGSRNDDDDDEATGGMTQADVDRRAREIVQEELNSASAAVGQEQSQAAVTQKLEKHYDRAGELNVPDYEETEDAAIEVLGKDLSRFIMSSSNKSQLVLYYIGKNPAKGYELAQKIKSDPGSGAIEIGELASKLSLKQADTQNDDDLPEPDSDLGGDSASAASINEKKLVKMRAEVAAGKRSMQDLMKLKKELAKAG